MEYDLAGKPHNNRFFIHHNILFLHKKNLDTRISQEIPGLI